MSWALNRDNLGDWSKRTTWNTYSEETRDRRKIGQTLRFFQLKSLANKMGRTQFLQASQMKCLAKPA